MVRAEDMTPEEAKKYLAQQQEKVRKRQQAYVKNQFDKGKRRVSVYVSPEAGEFLDGEIERTGKGAADIVSEALLMMKSGGIGMVSAPIKKSAATSEPVKRSFIRVNPDYDQEKTEAYIMQLYSQGFSLSAIANTLNEKEWPTQKTGGAWYHKTVGSIVKRLKDDG